jgi:hypothetical protein
MVSMSNSAPYSRNVLNRRKEIMSGPRFKAFIVLTVRLSHFSVALGRAVAGQVGKKSV